MNKCDGTDSLEVDNGDDTDSVVIDDNGVSFFQN